MTITLPLSVEEAPIGEHPIDLDDHALLGLHAGMLEIRAFEEAVLDAFQHRLAPGTTHVCIAQEAIKTGAMCTLEASDQVLATYRGHGEAIAKGVDPSAVMAEVLCREDGVCHGKGGSMHLSAPEHGLVMTNAIVAAHIPTAGGVALSAQIRNTDQVVLCFFGDGAACEGEFFETLNMAMIWKIPLVFICENNGKAISVPLERSHATPDIADRAGGFGMPSIIVDGNDVLAVRDAVGGAVAHARAGAGPFFVECKTVRWDHHSGFSARGDDLEARAAWQRVDPIARFRKRLIGWEVADQQTLDQMYLDAQKKAAQARAFAEASPHPGPESVHEHIFAP